MCGGRFRLLAVPPVTFLIMLATLHPASASVILSDNIGKPVAYGESVTASEFVASSFGTDGLFYTLVSVELLMREIEPGSAVAEIYADDSFQPGTLIGTLDSPEEYPGAFAQVYFSGNGITLSPWSTYWVVLSAASGGYEWAWTEDSTGDGVGFQHTFAISFDGGATWPDVFAEQPQLMRVTAATPEPATLPVVAFALGVIALVSRRHSCLPWGT